MNYQEETSLPGDIRTMQADIGGHRQSEDGLKIIVELNLIFNLLSSSTGFFESKQVPPQCSVVIEVVRCPTTSHDRVWEIQAADSSSQCQPSEGSNKGWFVCVQVIISSYSDNSKTSPMLVMDNRTSWSEVVKSLVPTQLCWHWWRVDLYVGSRPSYH